jgi:hypothetical protein
VTVACLTSTLLQKATAWWLLFCWCLTAFWLELSSAFTASFPHFTDVSKLFWKSAIKLFRLFSIFAIAAQLRDRIGAYRAQRLIREINLQRADLEIAYHRQLRV